MKKKLKIFEKNARAEKLAIDMKFFAQILDEENRSHDDAVRELDEKLQEVNRTHNDAVRELDEKLQEENRTHNDAIKELDEKIADLEKQIKFPPEVDSIPTEMPSEPAQETTEPLGETSTVVDEPLRVDAFNDVRELLQESKPIEPEVSVETPKKKRRSFL